MGTPFLSSISMPGDSFEHPAELFGKAKLFPPTALNPAVRQAGTQPPGEEPALWLPSSARGFGARSPVHRYV